MNSSTLTRSVAPPLAVAFALWTLMFGARLGNFWLMMTFSTLGLGMWALAAQQGLLKPRMSWSKAVGLGVLSAASLYGIFALGDHLSSFLPFQERQVTLIYERKSDAPTWLVGALLLIPIAPGEEIFWRGLVQARLSAAWGGWLGWIAATLIYGLVHLASLNFMLIAAALVCGAFWGLLYRATGSVIPGIISHALWDVAIFVVMPLR